MLERTSRSPLCNHLLAALPFSDFERLQPHLTVDDYRGGTMLIEDEAIIQTAYFPIEGMISLVVCMRNGDAVETATVGREGVVGSAAALGMNLSNVKAIVQMTAVCAWIPISVLKVLAEPAGAIRTMCNRYSEVLLIQARVTAACNALHHVDARLCRWILQALDRGDGDTVPLTQEFLAQMLGVRRSSVTDVALKLQVAGLIEYSRGMITVIDRVALEAASCECYDNLRGKTARLLSH